MILPDSSILTNIQFPGNAKPPNDLFEKKYISIRCLENRLYTDEEVEHLPIIARSHTHYREWIIRKKSSNRLINYLSSKKKRLRILEVGCGNGWLAHSLSAIPGSEVTGLDINFTELQQAARVFNEDKHLHFIYGDIYANVLNNLKFDVIVFAASIQYFQPLRKIITICLKHLSPAGEIHIIGSHFYKPSEINEAKKRSLEYFTSLGYPEMSDYYFHHQFKELKLFNHTIFFNPHFVVNRFLKNTDPFYWVGIKK
jgi:SAM-dependent methyltransferase